MVTADTAHARTVREHTARYRVAPSDSVRTLAHRGREFLRKPVVMASAKLLEVGEAICMEALRETLRPEQCSLGTRQLAAHRGAVRIGDTLAIAARRVGGEGPRSEWYVHMRDDHGDGRRRLVWEGMLSFTVVDLCRFESEKTRPRKEAAAPQPQRSLVRNR
ncbi:hypothetical protein L3Q65_01000 (plasmid) [Amycolatopsis sp. FU40]|uniref:hypothetical protein n=1 Tax=Amycolatopsis sp. FU40 TaxID=2914159 RepID=UPI001F2C22B0|nr:hypothetical protein [Amycolatopsis sp. FU40]UKD50903.1 hypothetical protein L3Q65_01000 [Amycolatopsis sp. FU40]